MRIHKAKIDVREGRNLRFSGFLYFITENGHPSELRQCKYAYLNHYEICEDDAEFTIERVKDEHEVTERCGAVIYSGGVSDVILGYHKQLFKMIGMFQYNI